MLNKALCVVIGLGFTTLLTPVTRAADLNEPRVSAMYTTWDQYYFYAGFQVSDTNVLGVNTTTVSQPQQDDDIEVFFETDNARANIRTSHTFQMAVSAANGAYFSVGDGTSIPRAKVVMTYKYAVRVDGTLNDPTDKDTGYTVELAIPWQELGLSAPPPPGTVWGFNVISRDRSSANAPSNTFYTLSPEVKSGRDIQNPSRWSRIHFGAASSDRRPTINDVVSSHILTRYPLINGSIVSGEWPSYTRLSFGASPIFALAPTVADEPNTSDSQFDPNAANSNTQIAKQPNQPDETVKPVEPDTSKNNNGYPTVIKLPDGGIIHVVPGGLKNTTVLPVKPEQSGTNNGRNPLIPTKPIGATTPRQVAFTGSLALGKVEPSPLVMAIYRIDFNADKRKMGTQNVWDTQGNSLLIDQPMDGCGPWFCGTRMAWHRSQLTDLRRAGINVALIQPRSDDKYIDQEVDALVAALQDLKDNRQDYPLIGVDGRNASAALITRVLDRIPAIYRARWTKAGDSASGLQEAIVLGDTVPKQLADNMPVAAVSTADYAYITPGGKSETGELVSRYEGQTYDAAWNKAVDNKTRVVVINSWNDFASGTELAASRQYGERYADITRLHTLQFNGNKEWHAKYLTEDVPRIIYPKVLYPVTIRVENAGTMPWRVHDGYALCVRWYRDGRIFDDRAPRVPLPHDVFPGQSITLYMGLVALNGYEENLEPGSYTLAFDMIQGEDNWFSYASDAPLQVAVKVNAVPAAPSAQQAVFVNSSVPVDLIEAQPSSASITLRNDGVTPWSTDYKLVYKIYSDNDGDPKLISESKGTALSANPVQPGDTVTVKTTIAADGLQKGSYRIHWYVQSPENSVDGRYDTPLEVVSALVFAAFNLADVPRNVATGKEFISKLAITNSSDQPWRKGSVDAGYHWYYLDGTEADWDNGIRTPIAQDVPGYGLTVLTAVKTKAPDMPGRYVLVYDVRSNDSWASLSGAGAMDDQLTAIVTVSGKNDPVNVDLSAYAGQETPISGGYDLPDEMLPPDMTGEVNVNPLLLGRPGAPIYPSGYYSSNSGSGWASNHMIPFLYVPTGRPAHNGIVCSGQKVALPNGSIKSIHILAMAAADNAVPAAFSVGGASTTLNIASWKSAPDHIAWGSPYAVKTNGDVVPNACYLGDYEIAPADGHADFITLPNDPAIRVYAITVMR